MSFCTDINWDSFTFIAATGQTLVSATELTTTNGSAIFNGATRDIEYTVGAQNCNVDLVQFTVEDVNGNISNIGTWYIDYEDVTAPVAVGDSVTVASGESATVSAFSNDTGDLDLSTYEVVTDATQALITNNGDGTFTVFAPEGTEGADSFTYRFKNPDGISSNTGTVSITIEYAGEGSSGTICPVAGVDLTSFLVGSVTAGGAWAADAGNPSAPSIAVPTAVDFSAATAGTYVFTYTIGSSVATITLELPDYSVTADSISTPTNNPIASSITSLVTFTTIGVTNANNIQIEVDFNSGTSFDYYPPDKWNPVTGEGFVTIEYGSGAGTYDVTVTVVDSCGNTQTDTYATQTIT